jgi:hypothetical protein
VLGVQNPTVMAGGEHVGIAVGQFLETNATFIAHAPEDIEYLLNTVLDLEERIECVQKLHTPVDETNPYNHEGSEQICAFCNEYYPCHTIRALEGIDATRERI